jgi:kinesin family protein C2/C3
MSGKSEQEYEDLIRRLKILSKCQSAFLKKFVGDKIAAATKVVDGGMDIIFRTNNNDPRLLQIKTDIAALRLDDLHVDPSTFQTMMKEELDVLSRSVNGTLPTNGSVSSGNSSAQVGAAVDSAETLARIKTLEQDNTSLRELLKEAQASLTKSQAAWQQQQAPKSAVMPPPPPTADNSAAIADLQSKISELQGKLADTNTQLANKDKEIASLSKALSDRTNELNSALAKASDADLARSLQGEVSKMKSDVASLESELKKARKEGEERVAAKQREMTALTTEKVAEMEKKMEESREEMMDAMAQEVEAIEKQNLAEKETLNTEKSKLEVALSRSKNSRQVILGGVAGLNGKVGALSREQKNILAATREQLNDMKMVLRTQLSDGVMYKLREVTNALTVANTRYRKEMAERKKLHNLVQELKGNIRVFLRCRPPSSRELEQYGNEASCISFPEPQQVRVFNEKSREKTWDFDEVFGYDSTQADVYTEVSALVTSVLDGYSVCIFAYGQTGSGKTFTMSGPADNRGVNTRALGELFEKTTARSEEFRDSITVSVLQVYNEDIHDLLGEGSQEKLEIRQGEFGNHVPGLTTVTVQNLQNVFDLLAVADRNRSQTATNMNEHSSRSHMMLTVTVISENLLNGNVTRGKLNLVDLAGSERINKSGATGQALKEAQNINKSLSALGDVIAARAQKQGHVPFRNSTLTFLLQESLSQDSKTLMIVCVSPVLFSAEETFCSLNFASRLVVVVYFGRLIVNISVCE